MRLSPHESIVGETKAVFFIKGIPILVDREDLSFVLCHRWNRVGRVYSVIQTRIWGRAVSLPQFLLENLDQMFDHKNRKYWDNRKVNFRPATSAQNKMNQRKKKENLSGYRGVSWHKRVGKWCVQIQVNKKKVNLGYYDKKEDAVTAFNEAVKKYHGEFAVLS